MTFKSTYISNTHRKLSYAMYYEEFEVGKEHVTSGRTKTETDIVIFAGLTGASNPLFLDEEYAKKSSFGQRIAPGLLTLSIATGLAYQLPTGPFGEGFVALLGMSFKALKARHGGRHFEGRSQSERKACSKGKSGKGSFGAQRDQSKKERVLCR